jgi:AcrR family transcriptional regulator
MLVALCFEQLLKAIDQGDAMAKAGRPAGTTTARAGAGTREVLVDAAVATLKEVGFVGASARAIAERAGCNQALVFYHFGSVVDLLLAALDQVSAERLARYTAAMATVTNVSELLAVAAAVFREDMDNGDVAVLAEMIAGTVATPGLGEQVAARIAPWRTFARDAIATGLANTGLAALIPLDDVAHAVVALYLGLEMLGHLDDDRTRALALFDHARGLAALLDPFVSPKESS